MSRRFFDIYQYNAYSDCYNRLGTFSGEDGDQACWAAKIHYVISGGLYYVPHKATNRQVYRSRDFTGRGMSNERRRTNDAKHLSTPR